MAPAGRLDNISAAAFREEVRQLVESGGKYLVVDLREVSFVDTIGLATLLAGKKLARIAGGDLHIACPGAQVVLALNLSSLDRILRPHSSIKEALAAFGSR